jgi:hypothetical protein
VAGMVVAAVSVSVVVMLRPLWQLVRSIAVDGDSVHDPFGFAVFSDCVVLCAAVIPESHRTFGQTEPAHELRLLKVVEEVVEDHAGLASRDVDDLAGVPPTWCDALLASSPED